MKSTGAVASAPFGSAMILPIPWMYITMLGHEGLRKATAVGSRGHVVLWTGLGCCKLLHCANRANACRECGGGGGGRGLLYRGQFAYV